MSLPIHVITHTCLMSTGVITHPYRSDTRICCCRNCHGFELSLLQAHSVTVCFTLWLESQLRCVQDAYHSMSAYTRHDIRSSWLKGYKFYFEVPITISDHSLTLLGSVTIVRLFTIKYIFNTKQKCTHPNQGVQELRVHPLLEDQLADFIDGERSSASDAEPVPIIATNLSMRYRRVVP